MRPTVATGSQAARRLVGLQRDLDPVAGPGLRPVAVGGRDGDAGRAAA